MSAGVSGGLKRCSDLPLWSKSRAFPMPELTHMGSFDCIGVRFANTNFAQDDRFFLVSSWSWAHFGQPSRSDKLSFLSIKTKLLST